MTLVLSRPERLAAQVTNDTVFVSVGSFPGGSPGHDTTGNGTRLKPYRQITRAMSVVYALNKHVIFVGPSRASYYAGPIYFPWDYALTLVSEKGADSTRLLGNNTESIVILSSYTELQVLDGFTISDNTAGPCGVECSDAAGGVEAYGRSRVINNKILRNKGRNSAGGIYYSGYLAPPYGGVIANNWIGGNSDTNHYASAGGIGVGYCQSLLITNNTIVGNSAIHGAGILLSPFSSSGVTIANNIIAYNQVGWGIFGDTTPTNPVYNLFFQNAAGNRTRSLDPTNILNVNPLLVSYPSYDYHLACHSPAIDKGWNSYVAVGTVWDIDGSPQGRFGPAIGRVDIGADEFWDTNKHADFFATVTSGILPLTVIFTNQSLCLDEHWVWNFGEGPSLTGYDTINKNPSHRYDTAGVYSVRLVAWGDLDSDTLTRTGYIQVSKPAAPSDTVFVSIYGFPGGVPGSDVTGNGSRFAPYRQIYPTAMNAALAGNKLVIFVGPSVSATVDDIYNAPVIFPYGRSLRIVSEKGPDSTRLWSASGSGTLVSMWPDTALQVLEGFTVSDNHVAVSEGRLAGGIRIYGKGWVINNKILRNSGAGGGGGIYVDGSGGVIAGNWIGDNEDMYDQVSSAGGIYVGTTTSLTIVNNTIVNNKGRTGAGILLTGSAQGVVVANNIFAYSRTGYGIYGSSSLSATPAYNLFYLNFLGNTPGIPALGATNLLNQNPLLVNYPAWDYHLACYSPAIDKGSNVFVPSPPPGETVLWDIDGPPQRRLPLSGSVDIGGDEFYDTNKKADFFATVTVGCLPLTVAFTNQSLCVDEQWMWDFGDGGSSASKNPSHRYDTAGLYTVRLIAKGDLDSDTLTRPNYIRVSKTLTPDLTANVTKACDSLNATFSATLNDFADSLRWFFGDGGSASTNPASHRYATSGNYNVELRAYNSCGTGSKLKSQYISVGRKPNIGIAASSDSVQPPLCSPYTVRLHPITDQPLLTYKWDFGDGDTTGASQSNPSHTYLTGGGKSVRLVAAGDCGIDTAMRPGYIQIQTRPTAALSASPITGCAGTLTADFAATYSGTVYSSVWFFGDGDSASGPVTQHSYSSVGVYHASLVLIHLCGIDTLYLSTPITVGVAPVAGFSGSPLLGYEPLSVQFTDLSTNSPASWHWAFGDAGESSSQNPVHAYTAGWFDVSLLDSNACGVSADTVPKYVHVGGFQPSLDSSGVRGDTVLYNVLVDSLFRTYDRPVLLSVALTASPRRGSVTFGLNSPSGTPRFATSMTALPSGDLATGDYTIELSAIDPRITKRTSRVLHHAGRQLISVTPDTLQFGPMVFGGPYGRQVSVRNNASVLSGYKLRFTASTAGLGFSLGPRDSILNPQASGDIQVLFTPTFRTDYTGTLTINSDDPAKPEYRVVLLGRGSPELNPPVVSATVPPAAFGEIRIDSAVRFIFSEPVIAPGADSLVIAGAKRTGGPVGGALTFSSGSPLLPFNWLDFKSPACVWFPPDDTLSFRVRAVITDTAGNHLDGNRNDSEEGSPADDYLFSVSTGPGVRPGDADQNKRVDERDILPLARFMGLTGPARTDPCTGFTVQPATAWSPRGATHADADGSGAIDSADICPIAQYFDVDSSLSKVAVEEWMSAAKAWDNGVVRALIGGLIDCPEESKGRDVLRRFLEGLQTVAAAPLEFTLSQNYPNPFNPATVIEYSLKRQTKVRLEIFDIQGRLVTVLEDEEQQPGRHSCIWDGHDTDGRPVASGIYFYRLVTPEFRLARKMVLMK